MQSISAPNRYLLALSLSSVMVFAVDQITKQLALNHLSQLDYVEILGSFLRLTLAYNEGGAFSTKLGSAMFYTISMAVVIVFLIYLLYKDSGKNKLFDFSLALVLGGAMGNLADRLRLGKVVDFIDADFFDINIKAGKLLLFEHSGYRLLRWPVFNIADIAVTVGIVLVAVVVIFHQKRQRHAPD